MLLDMEHTLVRRGILGVEGSNPLDEGLHPALLEDAHEGRLESLASIRGDLSNGSLGARALLNVAAGDLLELEVTGDIGGDEDIGQLARGHEELGNEVDVPVVDSAVLLPGLLASLVVAILLEELYVEKGNRSDLRNAGQSRSRYRYIYRFEVNGRSLTIV